MKGVIFASGLGQRRVTILKHIKQQIEPIRTYIPAANTKGTRGGIRFQKIALSFSGFVFYARGTALNSSTETI